MDLVAIGTNVVIGVNVLIAEIAEVLLLIQYFEKTVEWFLDVLVFSEMSKRTALLSIGAGTTETMCSRFDMHALLDTYNPRSCHWFVPDSFLNGHR